MWKEAEGRGRKSKEEQGRGRKRKEGGTMCGCAGVRVYTPPPLRFQIPCFLTSVSAMFGFLPPPFWFPALLFVTLFAVSLPFSPPTHMVDPTLRLFFSSLVGFPHPFSFFPPSFRLFSHVVVYPLFCVVSLTLFFHKPVFCGALFCFYLPVICFVRIPLRFFIVWVFINPFVCFPPFWCCSLSCFCSNFLVSPINCSFLLLVFCHPISVSPPLPFGFPPTFALLVLISLSLSHFPPLLQSFSSLEVCLSVFRSLSHCLSLNSKGTKKMMLTCLSESPINGTGFLYV